MFIEGRWSSSHHHRGRLLDLKSTQHFCDTQFYLFSVALLYLVSVSDRLCNVVDVLFRYL